MIYGRKDRYSQCRDEVRTFIAIINNNRRLLTAQQHSTLKGQALSGDLEGAWRGLKRIMSR